VKAEDEELQEAREQREPPVAGPNDHDEKERPAKGCKDETHDEVVPHNDSIAVWEVQSDGEREVATKGYEFDDDREADQEQRRPTNVRELRLERIVLVEPLCLDKGGKEERHEQEFQVARLSW